MFQTYARLFSRTFGKGVLPHQMAWVLDFPGRHLLVSPKLVAQRLALSSDATVLEVGPGSGYFSVDVAKKIPHGMLHLIDVQPEMLVKTARRLLQAGVLNFDVHKTDGIALPLEDNSMDAIFLVTVFGEIESQQQFLQEAARVLRPKGILSITEHHPDPDFESQQWVTKKAVQAGFTLAQVFGWRFAYTLNFTN